MRVEIKILNVFILMNNVVCNVFLCRGRRGILVLMTCHHYWPMTSFTTLSCISHREFTVATMALGKIGATESLLISEKVCCFKCACWDRGWDTNWTSSQEKVHFVIHPNVFLYPHFLLICTVKIWDQWIWRRAQLLLLSLPLIHSQFGVFCVPTWEVLELLKESLVTKNSLLHSKRRFLWQRKADLSPMAHVCVEGTWKVSEKPLPRSELPQPLTDSGCVSSPCSLPTEPPWLEEGA